MAIDTFEEDNPTIDGKITILDFYLSEAKALSYDLRLFIYFKISKCHPKSIQAWMFSRPQLRFWEEVFPLEF